MGWSPIHVLIPTEVDEALEKAASDYKTTKSKIIRNLLIAWLTTGGYLPGPETGPEKVNGNVQGMGP